VAELVSVSGTQSPWACVVEPQGYPDALFLVRVLEYKLRCHQELRHGPYGNDRYPMMAAVLNLGDVDVEAELAWRPPGQADASGSGEPSVVPRLEWSLWVVNLRQRLAQPLLEEIASGRVNGCLLAWVSLMADADQPGGHRALEGIGPGRTGLSAAPGICGASADFRGESGTSACLATSIGGL
jgi:hypothetical protein